MQKKRLTRQQLIAEWTEEDQVQYEMLRQAYTSMVAAMVHRSQERCAFLDVSGVCISADETSVDLTSKAGVKSWFDRCRQHQTLKFIESLKRDLGIQVPAWWDLTERKLADTDPVIFRKRMWIQTWGRQKGKMFEWASALSLLEGSRPGEFTKGSDLHLDQGPFPVKLRDNAKQLYVWPQVTIHDGKSGLNIRPDFTFTLERSDPCARTTVGILECKAVKAGGGGILREVFAKGYELGVHFQILAYHGSKKPKLERAAHKLGIGFLRDMFLTPAEAENESRSLVGAYKRFFERVGEEEKESRFEKELTDRKRVIDEKRARRGSGF